MKVTCIDDRVVVSTGFFSSEERKSHQLTFGKTYDVVPTIIADNHVLMERTVINAGDTKFMLYDDSGTWSTWEPRRFKPV